MRGQHTPSKAFFPPRPGATLTLYAYADTNPQYDGLLKVGYTTGDAKTRIAQQYPTKRPGGPRSLTSDEIAFIESTVRPMVASDGSER